MQLALSRLGRPGAAAVAGLCCGLAWGLPAAAAQHHQPAGHASTAVRRAVPLTSAQMARQLTAEFEKAPFAHAAVHVAVKGHVISIGGRIALAEHRGIATRDARRAARAAHWTNYRVINTLRVQ